LEQEIARPDFWDNAREAAQKSQRLAELKEEVARIDQLRKELEDFKELLALSSGSQEEMQSQIQNLQYALDKEEFRAFLSAKYDRANAILTITAGAGGQDAQDWAALLTRMYQRYCERKGWKISMVDESFGDPGQEGRVGIKQISFEIKGGYAFGMLKGENGVHRLVRISPFSAKSLRHTSFASVEVTPEVSLKEETEIALNAEDLQTDFFRASGPGGQNVNKRETAVRIVHKPTGIVVTSQSQRSQQQNKEKALDVLASKLYVLKEKTRQDEMAKARGEKRQIEWGSQIRSYVLHPYRLVKDVRTDVEVSNAEAVLDGDLDVFIEAEIRLMKHHD